MKKGILAIGKRSAEGLGDGKTRIGMPPGPDAEYFLNQPLAGNIFVQDLTKALNIC